MDESKSIITQMLSQRKKKVENTITTTKRPIRTAKETTRITVGATIPIRKTTA